MGSATKEITFDVLISPDRLRAHLVLPPHCEPVDKQKVLGKLLDLGISLTDEIASLVGKVVASAEPSEVESRSFPLLAGREAIPGLEAVLRLTPNEGEEPSDETGRMDFHASHIRTVRSGDLVGIYTPATPPQPGLDVFGKTISSPPPQRNIEFGKGICPVENGPSTEGASPAAPKPINIVAACDGMVHITRSIVDVLDVVEIPGDVDLTSGNLDAPGDILIRGTIRESFEVHSAKAITVNGTIEPAVVEAGTDIRVIGGIAGHNRSRVVAGGELIAKFCNEANLRASQSITIVREAINCRIHTSGKLMIPNGSLIGGYAYARMGMEIGEVGTGSNTRGTVAIGVDPEGLQQAKDFRAQIDRKRQAMLKIRAAVQPLQAQMKRLTAQQREKATELLFQADEMEQEIADLEKQRTAALNTPPAGSEISLVIQHALYPAVTLIFGDRCTTIRKLWKGSHRVVRRTGDGTDQIVIWDSTGHCTPQVTSEYVPPAANEPDGASL